MTNTKVIENNTPNLTAKHCELPSGEYLSDAPIVAISGLSESGKTMLIADLIPELKRRGYKVATIKHAHDVEFDPGKDSSRHLEAGSQATLVSCPNKMVLIKPATRKISTDEMLRVLGDDNDVILCEGFKYTAIPKIVAHRQDLAESLPALSNVLAIVSDVKLETETRQYSFQDIKAIADLIEEKIILPHIERINICVNNKQIPLIEFPRSIITNTLLGLLSALKGVKDVRSIQINVRHQPGDKG